MTATIPHSREAEEALLGSLLINPDLLPVINLRADEFYIHRHQWIYSAMNAVRALDMLTLSDELERLGQLAEIGGPAYLTALVAQSPVSYNAEHYAAIIRENARRRADIQIGTEIVQGAYGDGVDRAKIIDMLTRNADTGKGASKLSDHLDEFMDTVEERAMNPCDVWGLSTGIADLDHLTGGLHAQQTTIIVGAPGVGKTTLMLQIGLHMAKEGHPGVVYELEMDLQPRLIGRLVSMLTGISPRAMMTGRMKEEHWPVFTHGIEQLAALPLYVSDNPVTDTMAVRADVARMKAQHGIEFVALDYLNLLTDSDGDTRNENTTAKATRFRQLCREFDVAGLTVQSVNKEGMKAIIPSLADMSGPADVAFTADNVFFLVREPDKPDPPIFNLLPAKQRDGDMGNKPIKLIQPKGKLGFECMYKGRE